MDYGPGDFLKYFMILGNDKFVYHLCAILIKNGNENRITRDMSRKSNGYHIANNRMLRSASGLK